MEIGSQWERRSEQKGLGLVTCPGKVECGSKTPIFLGHLSVPSSLLDTLEK